MSSSKMVVAELLALTAAVLPSVAYGEPPSSASQASAAPPSSSVEAPPSSSVEAPLSAPAPFAPSPHPAPTTIWTPQKRFFASAGATAFVLPYLASAVAATTGYPQPDGDSTPRGVLWVPAVGPFIALGDGYDALASFFLVLDGVAQIGGLSLFVYGLALPAPTHADDDSSKHAQITHVTVTPTMVHGAPGGAVAFTF